MISTPLFFSIVDVDLLEPVELLVLGADQCGPVETRRRDAPAKARGVGEGVGELRAIDQELFRHAAAAARRCRRPGPLDDRHPAAIAAARRELATPPEPAPIVIMSKS